MKVIINGAEHILDEGLNINALLLELKVNPKKVAIEQNLAIVPASEYEKTNVKDGDKIEIVQFIGGG